MIVSGAQELTEGGSVYVCQRPARAGMLVNGGTVNIANSPNSAQQPHRAAESHKK